MYNLQFFIEKPQRKQGVFAHFVLSQTFSFLVSTIAAIHIFITVKYNFIFSLSQLPFFNCQMYFSLLNVEIELTNYLTNVQNGFHT